MKKRKYTYVDDDQEDYLDSKKIAKIIKDKKTPKKRKKLKDDFADLDDWEYEG